jgi:hypothetical protein
LALAKNSACESDFGSGSDVRLPPFPLYVAHPIRSRCSPGTSGRRSGLWDTTEAETTLGNVPNAERRMSASRTRSSLRAMLRLAKEGRRANNGLATRASYSGWHFAGVAKSAAHYQYNAVAPALSTDTPGQDRATGCVPRRSGADISSLCRPAHSPSANTKSPLPTATKDLLSDLFCGSR